MNGPAETAPGKPGPLAHRIRRAGRRAVRDAEFERKRTFWVVAAIMAVAGYGAATIGGHLFVQRFALAPRYLDVAGVSLAVSAMCLVAAAIALVNACIVAAERATRGGGAPRRPKVVRVDVPRGLEPYIPVAGLIFVGVLIGKTIFR